MCNLYSITTNQAAIAGLFRRMNRYVGNLAPMPGVFPDYPAPVIRNIGDADEMVMMRWGLPPPPRTGGPPVTNIRNTSSPHWRGWLKPENRCLKTSSQGLRSISVEDGRRQNLPACCGWATALTARRVMLIGGGCGDVRRT